MASNGLVAWQVTLKAANKPGIAICYECKNGQYTTSPKAHWVSVAFISNVSYASVMVAVEIPTADTTEQAKTALVSLRGLAKGRAKTVAIRPDTEKAGDVVRVPREAFALFLEILGHMANGNAVTLVPIQAELTTQQAADLLHVSRPFLIKLLEEGKLPFHMVGTHRRIKAADLFAYKKAESGERKKILAEMANEAQKHGLY